jgi:hypothetical protein
MIEQRDAESDLAVCRAATPGPWTHGLELEPPDNLIEGGRHNGGICSLTCHGNVNTVAMTGQYFSHADATFIATAREALPWWVAEAERLRAENADLKRQLGDALVAPSPTAMLEEWAARPCLPGGSRWYDLIFARRISGESVTLQDFHGEQYRTVQAVRKGKTVYGKRSNSFVVVEAGTDEKPATLDEMILAALAKWEELYGE